MHGRSGRSLYEATRASPSKRGYDARHRRWRAQILARDPLCRDPFGVHAERREIVASEEADHILPLEEGGDFSIENGQGLCKTCHSRKTAIENRGIGR